MSPATKACVLCIMIVVVACSQPSHSHADYYCTSVGKAGFYFNDPPQEFTFEFIAKPGVSCPQKFGVGSTAMLKDIIYQEDAKHGTVTLQQSGSIYTANRAYHGKDSFVLRVCAIARGKYGCADVRYSVTVE